MIKSNSAADLPTAPGLTFLVIKHENVALWGQRRAMWVESNLTATRYPACRPPEKEAEEAKAEAAALALSQKDQEVSAMRAKVQSVADQLSAQQTKNERLKSYIEAAGSEGGQLDESHGRHSANRYVMLKK